MPTATLTPSQQRAVDLAKEIGFVQDDQPGPKPPKPRRPVGHEYYTPGPKRDARGRTVPPRAPKLSTPKPRQQPSQPAGQAETPEQLAARSKDGRKFLERFGLVFGGRWFAKRKTFKEGVELIRELTKSRTQELTLRGLSPLMAAGAAQAEFRRQQREAKKPAGKPTSLAANLGGNLAKAAAGIKLPG